MLDKRRPQSPSNQAPATDTVTITKMLSELKELDCYSFLLCPDGGDILAAIERMWNRRREVIIVFVLSYRLAA